MAILCKRNIAGTLAITATITLASCGLLKSKLTDYVPISFTNEDQDQITAGLIGREFLTYRQDAKLLTEEDIAVIKDWTTEGSDWSTYRYVVGEDGEQGYVLYVKADDELTTGGRQARLTEVAAWGLNLEVRHGQPQWEEEK